MEWSCPRILGLILETDIYFICWIPKGARFPFAHILVNLQSSYREELAQQKHTQVLLWLSSYIRFLFSSKHRLMKPNTSLALFKQSSVCRWGQSLSQMETLYSWKILHFSNFSDFSESMNYSEVNDSLLHHQEHISKLSKEIRVKFHRKGKRGFNVVTIHYNMAWISLMYDMHKKGPKLLLWRTPDITVNSSEMVGFTTSNLIVRKTKKQ